jgi:hypothetical protein
MSISKGHSTGVSKALNRNDALILSIGVLRDGDVFTESRASIQERDAYVGLCFVKCIADDRVIHIIGSP